MAAANPIRALLWEPTVQEQRHPHPHVDPRQPRNESAPGANPPVFAWKPAVDPPYRLLVARDAAFTDIVLDVCGHTEPSYLPETAFAPGRYFWRWLAGSDASDVFTFEITADAVVLEVPPVDEWLRPFPAEHPRLYIRPDDVDALRESIHGARAQAWAKLKREADAFLAEEHEISEPPYLPDRRTSYAAFYRTFRQVMWDSRRFVRGAEIMALAYLSSGEASYARAARQRLSSICKWDPEGSSYIGHNDEAHMPIIWHGPTACDWVWDSFDDAERERVVEHFRRRGQLTFDHMHGRGSYGVTRFDSHAGREIVFLAQTALLIHEHAPEAREWLEWLRPVLCGIWPIWAGDDGGWAEGISYSLAYVTIMTQFATALKRGAGVNLYQRPFWRGHARWRQWCQPPYAEWIGFGDHTERWSGSWKSAADLVETIARETGTDEFDTYIAQMREETEKCPVRAEFQKPWTNPILYLAPLADSSRRTASSGAPGDGRILRVFPAVGWAAIRTRIADAANDVAMIFRSSPYAAISHSHANNNDFILHVAGKVMAMPSGYYCGYGSGHHAHWVWHTKSHNCITLSDAGQLMRSHDSAGSIDHAFEDERLVYFRGTADASYADRAQRCRRHVLFLRERGCFVLVDEFAAKPGVMSALQWNIHSWNTFDVDEPARTFAIERDGSTLTGHFMYQHESFFTLTEGWEPPPLVVKANDQWRMQYHLRFTADAMPARVNLGVVLCPGHASLDPAPVQTERLGNAEVARIGDDLVLVNMGGAMDAHGIQSDAIIAAAVGGQRYDVTDEGVARV